MFPASRSHGALAQSGCYHVFLVIRLQIAVALAPVANFPLLSCRWQYSGRLDALSFVSFLFYASRYHVVGYTYFPSSLILLSLLADSIRTAIWCAFSSVNVVFIYFFDYFLIKFTWKHMKISCPPPLLCMCIWIGNSTFDPSTTPKTTQWRFCAWRRGPAHVKMRKASISREEGDKCVGGAAWRWRYPCVSFSTRAIAITSVLQPQASHFKCHATSESSDWIYICYIKSCHSSKHFILPRALGGIAGGEVHL